MRDVAAHAGVSIASVSRVVNGTAPTRAATTQKVQAAVDALGFRPNAVGRSLRTDRTRTFGVMVPAISNPVFAEAVAGLQSAAREAGYTVLITYTDYVRDAEASALQTMLSHRVDALVLTVADPDSNPLLDQLDAEERPYVLIYNQPNRKGRSAVTVDNVAAGRAVAETLVGLGHRRLGMVSGRFHASDRARARHRGFAAGLADAGLAAPALLEVDFTETDIRPALAGLYAATEAPTALFCSNDLLAIAVMGALRMLGKRVPEDVSVFGFDGIAVGALIDPTLATVVQPSREMGEVAIHHLLDRLAGCGQPQRIILPHRLRLGGSVGAAPPAIGADRSARGINEPRRGGQPRERDR